MDLSLCKHIRIPNDRDYEKSIQNLIRSVEYQFKTDFTLVPNWNHILKCVSENKQRYDNKIKSARLRKLFIIEKLHTQSYRPSPFRLTDTFARTAYVWKEIEANCKRQKELQRTEETSFSEETNYLSGEISDMKYTVHPNSEINLSENIAEPTLQTTAVEVESKTSFSHLPVFISTNPHKTISPLESQHSKLNEKLRDRLEGDSLQESPHERLIPKNQTKCITCTPKKIEIILDNIVKKKVQFYLTNTCTQSLNIRFAALSDNSFLKKVLIYPKTPTKLCPGLSQIYSIIFKLEPSIHSIELLLYFRIGYNILSGVSEEVFSVPVSISSLDPGKIITVTKVVNISPVYAWQINFNSCFPKGNLEISVEDCGHDYYIHIKKREVDFTDERDDRETSIEVTGLNTDSALQRMEDDDIQAQSVLLTQSKKEVQVDIEETINNTEIIALVLDDVIKLALEKFVLEKTFLVVRGGSKSIISVFFTKAEHEGYHQSYYDLEFYDTVTDSLIVTKSVKMFSEILCHPVKIDPNILDLSESAVHFGYREAHFIITNSHKVYPVIVKIDVTKNMKKLFRISPMEVIISSKSNASFLVRACSTNNELNKSDSVHFTIKIILTKMSGQDSIYNNVPPIFYEIIVPCATEFQKIYSNMS